MMMSIFERLILYGFYNSDSRYDVRERLWPRNHLKKLILAYAMAGLIIIAILASVAKGQGVITRFWLLEAYLLTVSIRAYLNFWLTRGAMPRLNAFLRKRNLYHLCLIDDQTTF